MSPCPEPMSPILKNNESKVQIAWSFHVSRQLIWKQNRHRWNTRIFPVTKIWYPVKTQFLSFTCEDITVVMVTSISAHRKRASQHLAIVVYIINRILHARLWICILSSTREISSWTREDKIRIHVRACNILYFFARPSTPEQSCLRALEFCVLHFSFSINGELTKGDSAHRVPTFLNNIFPQGCKT